MTLAVIAGPAVAQSPARPASWHLGRLPDGVEKRRFIIDCTGCHQFDSVTVGNRTRAQWDEATLRMLGFAGHRAGFPVISGYRATAPTGEWLATSLAAPRAEWRAPAGTPPVAEGRAEVTEFEMSSPTDLLHDVAVDSSGMIVVTGMFSGAMYLLEPDSRTIQRIATPGGGARAVELDAAGNWYVALGNPPAVAIYDVGAGTWSTTRIPHYPHSIGVDAVGRAWFNGHFTHTPEQIGSVQGGAVSLFDVPPHPAFAPQPYELRVGADGRVWMSELQGNRIVGYTPATGRFETWTMPTPFSGPRRFDVDRNNILWIPAYAANLLVRLDPSTGRFEEIPLPEQDVLPYVARVDHGTGLIWVGSGAADAAFSYDPRARRWTRYALPSRGALVRHMAIDPRSHDVWLAYGASPGRISARIARLRVSR